MNVEDIEDIYELSPLQQGLVFHTLYAPNSGVYFEQLRYDFHGSINSTAYENAWQTVLDRNPVLRTSFHWEELDKPIQVVHNQVKVPLLQEDWRHMSREEQLERQRLFLKADRERGFDLSEAPLFRLALLRFESSLYNVVISHHHAILDGWSLTMVFKEFVTFYDAYYRGQDLQLPHHRPYGDYIAWLQQQDLNEAKEFWHNTLQGYKGAPTLWIDRYKKKISEQEIMSKDFQFTLSKTVTKKLKQIAIEHQLTLNTIVQCAWAFILMYYTGEDDVVFGATVSGRPAEMDGVEGMVGLFINTLPVRVSIRANDKIISVFQQLQSQQTQARQYEYSPLVNIQEWSDIPRGTPIFETIMGFENYPIGETTSGNGRADIQQDVQQIVTEVHAFERTNYPISLIIGPGQQLWIKFLFHYPRFEETIIAQLAGHFQNILENIANYPDMKYSDLSILTHQEVQRILVAWNNTSKQYDSETCIHQLVELQAKRAPDAIAVVAYDKELTYQQLNSRANQIELRLLENGIGPNGLVGVCCERSAEMISAMLGVLKAGGAYVPLEPSYPTVRLARMITDAKLAVVLTQQHLTEKLAAHNLNLICVDDVNETIFSESESSLVNNAKIKSNNIAYVIYTSGSTGEPKGVVVEHKALLNLVHWHIRTYNVTSDDKASQLAPCAFDACVWELWPYLAAGASVHIIDDVTRTSADDLLKWLANKKITIGFVPTPLAEAMFDKSIPAEINLKTMLIGGDRLRKNPQKPLPFAVVNHYGPTEAAVVTTFAMVIPGSKDIAPIGRPIANMQTYVLDRHQRVVPPGVVGELHISGDGLARGYLNEPELTKKKFILNPFSDLSGTRMYKTGDLVRYSLDGNLEFVGRIDHQVKIRGFRIELGEIEAVLTNLEAIKEAVVISRHNGSSEKLLVAYVVAADRANVNVIDLRKALQDQLPLYMIPNHFVILNTLPLTNNGKIDRSALPEPKQTEKNIYVGPRNDIEKALENIWSDVLERQRTSIYDDFFIDLGGHSLQATQLISRVRQEFDKEIPLQSIFDKTTIASLAEELEKINQDPGQLDKSTIARVERNN
jgi:amino acid adenylation domain-containing protein